MTPDKLRLEYSRRYDLVKAEDLGEREDRRGEKRYGR
jgi:hypothetical protein